MVKWRSLLAGALISAVCLWLLLRSVDLAKVGETLGQANPIWIALSFFWIALAIALRCWRWQLLFLPRDRVGFWGTLNATMIGYMFNTVLPGRVGELVRAALVSQTEHVSTPRALGTILVEKILDVMVLLLLLGGLTAALPLPAEVTAVGLSAAGLFGVVAVLFFVMSQFRSRVTAWVERTLDSLPLISRFRPSMIVDLVLGSADSLRQPRLLALHLVLAPSLWGIALLTNYSVMRAFGLDVPWTAAALVLVLTNLGMTVPSAPGYVGVYHYIAALALGIFGVGPETAAAVAIALHALAFGSFLIVGALLFVFGLARQNYTVTDLWRWRTQPLMSAK
jgi:glycosyltransferase 2 family protein